MKGWLVVSEVLKDQQRFSKNHDLLISSAKKQGIELQKLTNVDVLCYCDGKRLTQSSPDINFVLFYDKDITLALYLELAGYRLFNSAKAISLCDDKALTAIILSNKNIRIPKTIHVPKTYHKTDEHDWIGNFCTKAIDVLGGFPVIVKECYGSFGENQSLARINDFTLLTDDLNKRMPRSLIIQKYIEGNGYDLRIYVVGNEIVAAIKRRYVGDKADVSCSCNISLHEPSTSEALLAVTANLELGLDFSGVDILLDSNGDPLICEVNSNALLLTDVLEVTGINVADYMIRYIKNKIKEQEYDVE